MDIADEKAALRQEAKARRATIPREARLAFGERLAGIGPELARAAEARIVGVFSAFGDEVPTGRLIAALAAAGFATALPVVQGRGKPLVFRLWKPGDPVQKGQFGIAEPDETLPEALPDFLFVPLLAYDRRGQRIGYGAGYYDMTLAKLRALHRVTAVGVAFSAQEVLYVPSEDHDAPLDAVLNEREILLTNGQA